MPPPSPTLPDREKRKLHLALTLLVLCAIAMLFATKIPLPARLFTAAFNLVAAATLWLFARQNSNDTPR